LRWIDRALFIWLYRRYPRIQAAYPVHEERVVSLKNDLKIMIRPARAGDAVALQALFHRVAFLAVTGPRENDEVVGSACYFFEPHD
jgi:hypothetical protein